MAEGERILMANGRDPLFICVTGGETKRSREEGGKNKSETKEERKKAELTSEKLNNTGPGTIMFPHFVSAFVV